MKEVWALAASLDVSNLGIFCNRIMWDNLPILVMSQLAELDKKKKKEKEKKKERPFKNRSI